MPEVIDRQSPEPVPTVASEALGRAAYYLQRARYWKRISAWWFTAGLAVGVVIGYLAGLV